MIEHLAQWQANRFLAECFRVLLPEGIVRLATPDLGLMIADYANRSSPFLANGSTPGEAFCEEFNPYQDLPTNVFRYWSHRILGGDTHQWLYDFDSLCHLMQGAGFRSVTRCRYRSGAAPDLESVEHRERGLFVEGRKP